MPLAVGLMSGTSIDGIDAALVEISGKSPRLRIRLVDWGIFPFPKGLKERVLAVSHPSEKGVGEICRLNFELGELFAGAVIRLAKKARVPVSRLSVVGSHGQTICHLGGEGTLQIGEPSVIAERTGIATVADFRPRDIAAGGFGAPLAPYLHYLLFRHPKWNRAVQNLGGIGNLTMIPKKAGPEDVMGFDTGPGNMVIDGLLREMTKNSIHYDHGGKIAEKGAVSLKLLKRLMAHPFILKRPPKTSGREEFGRAFVQSILVQSRKIGLREEDIIATATAFTASSIATNYRKFVFPKMIPDEIIFGGGGIHNATLMRMIRAELPNIKISSFDLYGIPADAAEAVCFAVLAHETLHGHPTNIPSVTGAKRSAVLGKIVPGNSERSPA
ncbi:MAG TPA: anhydro-N-acetylmuramic acid kinase [bacterium]|nr:anhydro-N-acetylmuramic acid kinase [bacterium]